MFFSHFRPSGNGRTDLPPFHPSSTQTSTRPINQPNLTNSSKTTPGTHQIVTSNSVPSSGRIQSPAIATPAPRVSKEVAFRPSDQRNLNSSNPALSFQTNGIKTSQNHINQSKSTENIAFNPSNLPKYTQDVQPQSLNGSATYLIPERDTGPGSLKSTPPNCKPFPHRSLSGPAKLTIQSIPVKSQTPMLSSGLSKVNPLPNNLKPITNNKPTALTNTAPQITSLQSNNSQKTNMNLRSHNHGVTLQRVNECHSSSDENRSSGHASMSDTGHGSSSPGGNLGPLPEDRLAAANRTSRSRAASTGHSRSRHRGAPAKVPWSGGGLEDIKLAIQQLTMRSQTSTSTYSSLSAGSESSEPARRLGRYSSMETVNTNVTSADEVMCR